MKVIIINGAPRSGKDTFIRLLEEVINKPVIAYSSIDWIKKMAWDLGWDGKKDTKGRAFLSELKDACTNYDDTPFKMIISELKSAASYGASFFATNIREPAEIQKLKDWCDEYGYPCTTVRIVRDSAEKAAKEYRNTGDSQYMHYDYDWTFYNNFSFQEFQNDIAWVFNSQRGEK